ncbi:MAG: polysaccharide deacetylase family protein [Bdellovibrionaceae bacterium]|nr:polysaccharide deacetylase family protein [Pseudobdellovibrionaceae bacterium]
MINFFLIAILFFLQFGQAKEISITIDDPEVKETPLFDSKKRNQEILKALDAHQVKAALFVCGMRIDNAEGKDLLKSWDQKGHLIGNHTYSHLYFHSDRNSLEVFKSDFLKVEVLIKDLKNFSRIFRFPYLKEGNTNEKRDGMRAFLKEHKYQHGYVRYTSGGGKHRVGFGETAG